MTVHGKDAQVWLDDTGGSAQEISSYVRNTSGLPGSVSTHDVTTYGKEAMVHASGLSDATVQLDCFYDATLEGYVGSPSDWQSGTRTITYAPAGSASGSLYYRGELWITSAPISAPVGDIVTMPINGQVSDALTRGTF